MALTEEGWELGRTTYAHFTVYYRRNGNLIFERFVRSAIHVARCAISSVQFGKLHHIPKRFAEL